MQKILIILMSLIFLTAAAPGRKITNFKLRDMNNKWNEYSELKGSKLTVIDFWATWCKPCIRSIPKLVKLADKYKDQGVAFISINVDGNRSRQKIKPMARSLGINFPVLLDVNGTIKKQLGATAVPTLLIINEKDEVILFHQGYRIGDEKSIEKEIEDYLHAQK